LSIKFGMDELNALAVFTSTGYFIYLFTNKMDYKKWFIFSIVCLVNFAAITPSILNILFIISGILFFLLIYTKHWLSVVFALLICCSNLFISENVSILPFFILLYGVLYLVDKKTSFHWSPAIVVLTVPGLLTINAYKDYEFQKTLVPQTQIATSNVTNEQSANFLKEGRQLEYVENTLVLPHTRTEKIATGFLTLREYLRL